MAITENYTSDLLTAVEGLYNADSVDLANAIFVETYVDNDIMTEKEFFNDVKDGDFIPIINEDPTYLKFPKGDESSCAIDECDEDIEITYEKWQLGLMECRTPICLRSFDREFLWFWNKYQKKFGNSGDLQAAIVLYIEKKIKAELNAAMWRVGYFGDRSSTDDLLNPFTGIFPLLDAAKTAGGVKSPLYVEVTKNSNSTFSAQKMTGEEVYQLLWDMFEAAQAEKWFNPMTYQFEVTWEMAVAFAGHLNKLGHQRPASCTCVDPNAVGQMVAFNPQNIMFKGIPVIPRHSFSGVIDALPTLNNGGGANARVDPNRAILAPKSGLLFGTNIAENAKFISTFYSQKDRKIYIDAGAYMGAAIPQTNRIVVAY
ncbi:hypothetical protein [Elizabethkingia sp. M8]|uniref:hypothetical protein n=1 Tax=Elizabethkingia sp. M8 TaxID=2796140 RepID=UPI0019060C2E|nr:hypothetical protein [Elizabethkingia sp. M8]QQM25259.1 hypothetical protein JCR23_10100 [Elizabethkingia sp. M8]